MTVNRPFRRTYRPFASGEYDERGNSYYVLHPMFARSPEHYIRAFLLIIKDLLELFDYIEPADVNINCYSYRIHALLIRACVEVEANCKAILIENNYRKPPGKLCMKDYQKINSTHHLSSYQVKVPYWNGNMDIRSPFSSWSERKPLPWYQAYNSSKHNRHSEFIKASFGNLIDACCGLLVILSSQFGTFDFSPSNISLSLDCPTEGMEFGIGGIFHVKFPDDFPSEERYDFDWEELKNEADPFQAIDYS